MFYLYVLLINMYNCECVYCICMVSVHDGVQVSVFM